MDVKYDFCHHRYQIVESGPLTLDEAERLLAHKTNSLKTHTQNHHRQKIAELHEFLTETYERLTAVVENGEPDFYSGLDYLRLTEAVMVRVCRFGCTIKLASPASPIEALRSVGQLLAWTQDIIDRERPMTTAEVAARLNISVREVYSLVRREEISSFRIGRAIRVLPDDIAHLMKPRRRG
ncbi:MAG: helix-turn-helix domain-containing protein [Thermoguttaceae bacterium]